MGLARFVFGTAVEATQAYAVAGVGSTDIDLIRVPLDGGPAVTLATAAVELDLVAVDATQVYFLDSVGAPGAPAGILKSIPKTGGAPTALMPLPNGAALVALDATRLFWADALGGVHSAPR